MATDDLHKVEPVSTYTDDIFLAVGTDPDRRRRRFFSSLPSLPRVNLSPNFESFSCDVGLGSEGLHEVGAVKVAHPRRPVLRGVAQDFTNEVADSSRLFLCE